MDFSVRSWRDAINQRNKSVVGWLSDQGVDRGKENWSEDCVCLSREEQEILYARMMIEVPAEGEDT